MWSFPQNQDPPRELGFATPWGLSAPHRPTPLKSSTRRAGARSPQRPREAGNGASARTPSRNLASRCFPLPWTERASRGGPAILPSNRRRPPETPDHCRGVVPAPFSPRRTTRPSGSDQRGRCRILSYRWKFVFKAVAKREADAVETLANGRFAHPPALGETGKAEFLRVAAGNQFPGPLG